jgi:hypothetical protein
MLFAFPHTEASKDLRPVIVEPAEQRATISSPPGLRFSEDFLDRLRSPKLTPEPIDGVVANGAARFLRSVYTSLPALKPPTIAQGVDGCIGMTWETVTDHVNVEVFPDGHLEYFHEDLTTGALWNIDDVREATASQEILDRLQRAA